MREAGVDLGTIGLFALVGTPYTIKFLWAPLVDALDVPVLSRLLGRRRGWLVFSQLLLMAAIVFLAFTDPAKAPWLVAFGALLVATASATQDIVIDAFRVESLRAERAGRRHGVLCRRLSHRHAGLDRRRALPRDRLRELRASPRTRAWTAGYLAMAACVLIGIVDDAARDRAGEIRRRDRGSRRACRRESDPARDARRRTAPSRNSSPARWRSSCCCSWCSTSSATRSPAR